MRVHNKTNETLIAFGWDQVHGHGGDVKIAPGGSVNVNGPFNGEMGGYCDISLSGEITCHSSPDNGTEFQVTKGFPVNLSQGGENGVSVRHCEDASLDFVSDWRKVNQ